MKKSNNFDYLFLFPLLIRLYQRHQLQEPTKFQNHQLRPILILEKNEKNTSFPLGPNKVFVFYLTFYWSAMVSSIIFLIELASIF